MAIETKPIQTAVSRQLNLLFQQIEPITYRIEELGRFPEVLYLKVVDERPFIHLIKTVERAFSEYPSFGGQFSTIIPHITIAKNESAEVLKQNETQFWTQFPNLLPLSGLCETIWHVTKEGENYKTFASYTLGEGPD